MTNGELNRLVRKWQARLGLRDWNVEAVLVDSVDTNGDSFAEIDQFREKKAARMRILDEGERRGSESRLLEGSVEKTVVHELLHLHFEPLTANVEPRSAEAIAEEQAINAISTALVDAYETRG